MNNIDQLKRSHTSRRGLDSIFPLNEFDILQKKLQYPNNILGNDNKTDDDE